PFIATARRAIETQPQRQEGIAAHRNFILAVQAPLLAAQAAVEAGFRTEADTAEANVVVELILTVIAAVFDAGRYMLALPAARLPAHLATPPAPRRLIAIVVVESIRVGK